MNHTNLFEFFFVKEKILYGGKMGVGKIFSSTKNLIYGTFREKFIFNRTSNKFNRTPNKIIRKKIIKEKKFIWCENGGGENFFIHRESHIWYFSRKVHFLYDVIQI
jgi:hypothetical protein